MEYADRVSLVWYEFNGRLNESAETRTMFHPENKHIRCVKRADRTRVVRSSGRVNATMVALASPNSLGLFTRPAAGIEKVKSFFRVDLTN